MLCAHSENDQFLDPLSEETWWAVKKQDVRKGSLYKKLGHCQVYQVPLMKMRASDYLNSNFPNYRKTILGFWTLLFTPCQ